MDGSEIKMDFYIYEIMHSVGWKVKKGEVRTCFPYIRCAN